MLEEGWKKNVPSLRRVSSAPQEKRIPMDPSSKRGIVVTLPHLPSSCQTESVHKHPVQTFSLIRYSRSLLGRACCFTGEEESLKVSLSPSKSLEKML